ncbi:hypothetical protein Btru_057810 [Bulinus truncatus]|nr:hypothetical protein Btru_057810 [Bulinus truncatus]
MTEDTLVSFRNFTDINAVMEDSSHFCPCCQHTYGWLEEEGSEILPTELTCRHTICSTCVKSQWSDIGTSEDSEDIVFCFICSKRVGILSGEKSLNEESTNKNPGSPQNNVVDANHISLDEGIKEESSDLIHMTNGYGGFVSSDKDILLQEWVDVGVPENFIFRLVTTGSEQNIIGNTYILENGMMVQTDPSQNLDEGLNPEPDVGLEKISADAGYTTVGDGVTLQSNMIGSPDLNLKAFLQMLEKSSEAPLASAENCELNQEMGITNFNPGHDVEAVNGSDYMLNVSANPQADIDGVGLSEKTLSDQMDIDSQWLPVGIMQQAAYAQNRDKLNQNHPCTLYLQGCNVLPYTEKTNCLGSQSTTLHDVGKMNSDGWLSQMQRGIPQKSNPRPRRGRKKKPLFRHFQSEFFMRPYLKRENSPQLQLVKLVRQRAQEKKVEEAKAAETIMAANDNKSHDQQETEKGTLDDPELAFMKTVDMPSGKRVEDIYVVPPVWISSEKKTAAKPQSCSKEPHIPTSGSNMYNCFPMQTPQRIPVQVYPHGARSSSLYSSMTAQAPYVRHYQGYGQHHSAPVPSHHVQIPTLRTLNTSSDSSFRPSQNMYKVIKGHIITTLNAPKIGPVPTLRDICKAALGFHPHSSSTDPSGDNIYSYANGHHQFKFSNHKAKPLREDMVSAIKSPKEFLDMKGGVTHQELKLSEPLIETAPVKETSCEDNFFKELISQKAQAMQSNLCRASDSFPCLTDDNNMSDIYDTRMADKYSDSEETLPENPLVSEDSKQMERSKVSLANQVPCDFQVKNSSYKLGLQYYDQANEESAHKNNTFKENLKCMYTRSSASGLSTSNSDYVIPIVSYKLKEPGKNTYLGGAKPDVRQQEYIFTKGDNNRKPGTCTFNAPAYHSNFYHSYFDQQCNNDITEQNLTSLFGIAKQIKCLSSFEPLNKQLANLASALTLLCNAEKTLFESNFSVFRQLKAENESKLGRLNLCIRKLGDSIVTIGWTLQQWSKPTGNQCFKTMGILTDLYNSNITSLIELVTPYFHYICELIASCHSDVATWDKQALVSGEQMHSFPELSQRETTPWHELGLANTGGSSKTLSTFSYEETSKSSSPKEFPRQDNDHSLSSEDFMDRESEASNSGQTSAKTSPKIKVLVTSKRGRPLGSKNGQRKSRGQQIKGKPKRRFNAMSPADNLNYRSTSNNCSTKMLMPNTILVNMSSESFWNEANATVMGQAQNSMQHDNTDNISSHSKLISGCNTPWGLLSGDDVVTNLTLSSNNSGITLNLLDQTYQSNLAGTSHTSKDSSADNSPIKKAKLEDEDLDTTCPDLVYKIPKNVNILLQHSTSGDNCDDPIMDVGNIETSGNELQSYQNSIYYIKTENSDDELQLDNPLFSTSLIGSLKDNKDAQEKFQIAFLQDCPAGSLEDNVKSLMGSSLYSGSNNRIKAGSQMTEDLVSDIGGVGDFTAHPDPNDSIGDLCNDDANISDNMMDLCVTDDHNVSSGLGLCPNDVFDLSSSDNAIVLQNTPFNGHI